MPFFVAKVDRALGFIRRNLCAQLAVMLPLRFVGCDLSRRWRVGRLFFFEEIVFVTASAEQRAIANSVELAEGARAVTALRTFLIAHCLSFPFGLVGFTVEKPRHRPCETGDG